MTPGSSQSPRSTQPCNQSDQRLKDIPAGWDRFPANGGFFAIWIKSFYWRNPPIIRHALLGRSAQPFAHPHNKLGKGGSTCPIKRGEPSNDLR